MKTQNIDIQKKSSANKILLIVGRLIAILAIFYFIKVFMTEMGRLPPLEFDIEKMIFLGVAIALFTLANIVVVYCWQLLLLSLGEEYSYKVLAPIFLVSQVAKYIPGNVSQHIGRLALSKQAGIPSRKIITTFLIEILQTVVGCALVVIVVWIVYPFSGVMLDVQTKLLSVAAFIILLGVVLSIIFTRSDRIKQFIKLSPDDEIKLGPIGLSLLLILFLYFVNGFILWLISVYVIPGDHVPLILGMGIVAIAIMLGFLTPGAPAGIGVRETILLTLLTTIGGMTEASVVIILLRLTNVVADGISFLLGLYYHKKLTKSFILL